jgi:16S rRNA (cytosine1402-N4)-methyltransferase
MTGHVPVLLEETMAALALGLGQTYVDATLGAGGYMRAALACGIAHGYGFDRDPDAIARNADLAARPDTTLIQRPFSELEQGLAEHGVHEVDAIAFDIGISSMQIDTPERGFSFQADGPLDMRMSQSGTGAADIVNTACESELADILYHLGDEPAARRIARAIVADRPFTRTAELARLIRSVVGGKAVPGRDPATRSFQALRIFVNDELGQLAAGLDAAERLLRPGGRLAVVSFHSAEDRQVKSFLRERSGGTPGGSRHQPDLPKTRAASFARPARAVRPGAAELAANPRARSATLRAAVRTAAPAWSGPRLSGRTA